MDRIGARILAALQHDSAQPLAVLAERVGLSTSACHRRVKMFEDAGTIQGYAARLDPSALGLELEVFVEITLTSQAQETLSAFEDAVARDPAILECHLMTGDADYRLRVSAANMADYDRIHREVLGRLPGVASLRTSFAIRCIKPWRGYPVAGA